MIMVNAGNFTQGGVRQGGGNATTLRAEDAEALRQVPGVQYVAAGVNCRAQVIAGNQNWSTLDQRHRRRPAADSQLADEIRRLLHSAGRHQPPPRWRCSARPSPTTSSAPTPIPTGQIIRIRNQPFKVIGVMTSEGSTGFGQDQDDVDLRPIHDGAEEAPGHPAHPEHHRLGRDDPKPVRSSAAITETLRQRHKLIGNDPDDFMVRTQEEMASVRTETTKTMTTLLAAIAGVSLLVGGIGIMNIMLVSVTERTREIGLRMAIGARGKDVLLQFLVEAIVLSLFGGLLGIAHGLRAVGRGGALPAVADVDSGRTPSAWRSASPPAPACSSASIRRRRRRASTRSKRCGSNRPARRR